MPLNLPAGVARHRSAIRRLLAAMALGALVSGCGAGDHQKAAEYLADAKHRL